MRREKREREERPGRRVGFKTILHFIEIVVIAAAVVFVANRFAPKNETQITSSFISDKLEMVSELTTAKLTYNGLVYYSDGSIPLLTQKSFTMTYRAEVRAGVEPVPDRHQDHRQGGAADPSGSPDPGHRGGFRFHPVLR